MKIIILLIWTIETLVTEYSHVEAGMKRAKDKNKDLKKLLTEQEFEIEHLKRQDAELRLILSQYDSELHSAKEKERNLLEEVRRINSEN